VDRVLVVVFDNEAKASEGRSALLQLDAEATVFVYATSVVVKRADGTAAVRQEDGGVFGTALGTTLGTLIGFVGGPAGAAIGALSGMTLGMIADIDQTRVGGDFIDDVRKVLTPGKVALVADVEEDETAPVDTRMEKLGGTVFRRSVSDVRDIANDEDAAAIKADLAQLKAEHAEAKTERRAKLEDRINQLDSKLQARLQKAKEWRERERKLAQARLERLKGRSAGAQAKT